MELLRAFAKMLSLFVNIIMNIIIIIITTIIPC
jgi:hypothetical protein